MDFDTGLDSAHWLAMFHGDPMLVDRKSGTPPIIHVPSAAVSVTGGIQPAILAHALRPEYRESGLVARILVAAPPRRAKRWTDEDVPPELEAQLASIVDKLFDLRPDFIDDDTPQPVILRFKPEAKRIWVQFFNEHGEDQLSLVGDLAAMWSKIECYAPRLALIIHFLRWAEGDPSLQSEHLVDEVSMAAGVKLARWFGAEAKRVYGILDESEEDAEHHRLVELIERKGGAITVREWQQARSHRTSEDAEAELADLESAGHGSLHFPEQKGRGRPSKRFTLHSDDNENPRGSATGAISLVSDTDVPRARNKAAQLIRDARCRGDRPLAVALRDAWQERLAICLDGDDGSSDEAEAIALEELEDIVRSSETSRYRDNGLANKPQQGQGDGRKTQR